MLQVANVVDVEKETYTTVLVVKRAQKPRPSFRSANCEDSTAPAETCPVS